MAIQVGGVSPGEVRRLYRQVRCLQVRCYGHTGRWGVSRCGEMALQISEMSPGEVRWPYR